MKEYKNPNKQIKNLIGIELGPTYFECITQKITPLEGYEHIEWRARLNVKIKQIKFYGIYKFIERFQYSLIVPTNAGLPLVSAVSITDEEIVLFDGCKHGYDAVMKVYSCTKKETAQRIPDQILFKEGREFNIILSAFYTANYDEWLEMGEELNAQGMYELLDNSFIDFNELKRNSFNSFEILINEKDEEVYPIFQIETS